MTTSATLKCSSQKSNRYYRVMLHKIDIIKKSLFCTLSCSRRTRLNSSRASSLSQAKRKQGKSSRSTSRAETLKNNKETKTTIVSSGKEFSTEKRILNTASEAKTSSGLLTPKVKKKEDSIFNSPNGYFNSPFDECVFDKAETVRKVCLPRPDCFSGKEFQPKPLFCSRGDLNWQKRSKPLPEKQTRRKKYREENKENALSKVERPERESEDGWGAIDIGDVNRLQREFQLCLMKKKGNNPQTQSALRERMTEISCRITKIKGNRSNPLQQA